MAAGHRGDAGMTAIGGLRRNEAAAHPRTWIERRGEIGLARNRMDGFSPGSRGMAWAAREVLG